jgi:hypothetical protein
MRSLRAALAVVMLFLLPAPSFAKFGISKTKIVLQAPRPPELPVLAETVFLDIRGDGDVGRRYASDVQRRVEQAFGSTDLYKLVTTERGAGGRVVITLHDMRADIRDEVRTERKSVKVGTKQEWNEKKKKYEEKDVYRDRDVQVVWVRGEGSVDADVDVDQGGGKKRTRRLDARFDGEDKREGGLRRELQSESALRDSLIQELGYKAVAAVTFHPEPLEVLLAVNGELKEGNKLAELGRWPEALSDWNRKTYKGDTEAARLHNVGVAYEALAYRLPPFDQEHRDLLQKASEHYEKARLLDSDEKYFKPPIDRIAVSIDAARAAVAVKEDLDRFRKGSRPAAPKPR